LLTLLPALKNVPIFHLSEPTVFPPFDVDRLGVPQPSLANKDILIILFMFLLWGYSLYLTYRAWYKLLYYDGEERSNMWRWVVLMGCIVMFLWGKNIYNLVGYQAVSFA
jgi:hypothetical protein